MTVNFNTVNLVKEKKEKLIKLVEACKIYEGWQTNIATRSEVRREIIKHLTDVDKYNYGSPKNVELYNIVISSCRRYLKNRQQKAVKLAELAQDINK